MQEASEEESAPAETKETIQPRLIVCEQEAKSEEAAEAKEIVEPRTDVFIEARTSAELKKTDGMMIAAETRQESNLQAPTPSKENETRGGSQSVALSQIPVKPRRSSFVRAEESLTRLRCLMDAAHSNMRQRRFEVVQRTSVRVCAVGLLLYMAGYGSNRTASLACFTLGYSFVSVGAIMLSVCPANDCDLNQYFATSPRVRILIGSLLTVNALLLALAAPHAHIIAAGCSIWAAIGGGGAAPHTTTLFSGWLMFATVADGAESAYAASQFQAYSSRNNLSSAHSALLYNLNAFVKIAGALVLWGGLASQRREFYATNGSEGSSPTLILYQCINGYLTISGLKMGLCGAYLSARGDQTGTGAWLAARSIIILVPCSLVIVVGREALFRWIAHQVQQQWASRDGSTVVTVLSDRPPPARIGKAWWVEQLAAKRRDSFSRESPEPAAGYPQHQGSKRWQRGTVAQVETDGSGFLVRVDESELNGQEFRAIRTSTFLGSFRRVILAGAMTPTSLLVDSARRELRCIDWVNMTVDLLAPCKPTSSPKARSYSRRVRDGEVIDFFVSHACLDDAGLKLRKLQVIALLFREQHGRDPTFWIASACLGWNHLGSGLRVLPVHVEACEKMLMLCGQAYPKDLCCALELFTLFFLAERNEQAAEKLEVVELDGQALRQLSHFRIDEHTSCEDPNEERELRTVIGIAGTAGFIRTIRRYASWCTALSAGNAMQRFKSEREQTRRRLYKRVMQLAIYPFCVGLVFTTCPFVAEHVLNLSQNSTAACLASLGQAFIAFGVVVASTCPLQVDGFDHFCQRNAPYRIMLFFLVAVYTSTEAILMAPHFHVLATATSAWGMCEGRVPVMLNALRPKVSTLGAVSVCFNLAASGAHYVFVAIFHHAHASRARSRQSQLTYFAIGTVQLGGGILLFLWWRWQWRRYLRSNGTLGAGPTFLLFHTLYGYLSSTSVANIIRGFGQISTGELEPGILTVIAGMLQACPPLIVFIFGRRALFNIMAKRFERSHAVTDGAFIAHLLDTAVASEGDTWWVHRDAPNNRFSKFDHRRNWKKGVVTIVSEDDFIVTVQTVPPEQDHPDDFVEKSKSMARSLSRSMSGGLDRARRGSFSETFHKILKKSQSGADVVTNKPPEKPVMKKSQSGADVVTNKTPDKSSHTTPGGRKSIVFGGALSKVSPEAPPSSSQHRMPITSRGLSADELMTRAVSELRCIEWANLTRELLASSSGGGEAAALFTLSRPVRPGEQVDYFMSHSWHDDPVIKYEKLEIVVACFRAKKGRDPTFWLDKVIIGVAACRSFQLSLSHADR